MLHIKKTGTQFEAEGKKHTKDFIDSCWNDANHKYENLIYSIFTSLIISDHSF